MSDDEQLQTLHSDEDAPFSTDDESPSGDHVRLADENKAPSKNMTALQTFKVSSLVHSLEYNKRFEDIAQFAWRLSRHLLRWTRLLFTSKDSLARAYFGVRGIPETYCLPGQREEALQVAKHDTGMWIRKPTRGSCSRGVYTVMSLSKFLQSPVGTNHRLRQVIQRYVPPHLVGSHKYDIRIYVLVTSFAPLNAFYYPEGLARLTWKEFRTDSNVPDHHLTYRDLGNAPTEPTTMPLMSTDTLKQNGSLVLFSVLMEKMGMDPAATWKKIEALFLRLLEKTQELPVEKRQGYQFFGMDVMFDPSLEPWLLEVNQGPGTEVVDGVRYTFKSGAFRGAKEIVEGRGLGGYRVLVGTGELRPLPAPQAPRIRIGGGGFATLGNTSSLPKFTGTSRLQR